MSPVVGSAVRLHDQPYLNPTVFLAALADAVLVRSGRIMEATTVTGVEERTGGMTAINSEPHEGDGRYD